MDKLLVIGGHSGIGKATAELLSSHELVPYVPTSSELDVTLETHVSHYLHENGPFRYIVYSAGYNELCWINHIGPGPHPYILEETFDVNVFGFVNVVAHHLNCWPEEKVSVVAVSSDAAERPMRGSLAYCASKAALDMAIRCMARELAPLWRVNGVAPGMVEGTAMTEYIDKTIPDFRGWTPEHARKYEQANVPTGRRATLEEVAETIRWVLLGPEQMTGEIVKINGGR